MRLTITTYLDARATDVAGKLDRAVADGLDAAAGRIGAARSAAHTEPVPAGVRVRGGLAPLDGGELRVSGDERLTVLEFAVPWTSGDRTGASYRAANAFVHTVAESVATAA